MGGGLFATPLCVVSVLIRSTNMNIQPKLYSDKFTCPHCGTIAKQDWKDHEKLSSIVYPKQISIEPPNQDFNEDITKLYNEAVNIVTDSPKGAAAILRLALQKLLKQIGKDGKNINDDIKELVSEGLSPKIQKSLDLLRVVGNNAVHPGHISFDDDSDIALKLFKVLNIIADEMITRPKEVEDLYDDIIPEDTKKHIENRDKS